MDHRFRLLDDDGLIAVVARNAFAREFSRRAFDYHFPPELVRAVRRRWGVPAPTAGGGGVVEVHLRVNADGDAAAARHTWQLELELEDCLMIVPYSQFALAADGGGGFESIDGLSFAVSGLHPGTYDVKARSRSEGGRGGVDAFTEIVLTPARARANVIQNDWSPAI
jgi:hypothetical protein